MMKKACIPLLLVALGAGACYADRGQIVGTITDVRSGIGVSVHPVMIVQGRDTLARTLTDRLGKFKLEFTYALANPLLIRTGSTTGYLETQGTVEANTEVSVKVMPRWATILGIVTDRATGRGLANIPIQAGRGDKPITEAWATTKTDATGVYMLKARAFDGDDVTKPVSDLWLSINDGRTASTAYAVIRTDTIPLWAWPDPTQPTKVEISLPPADATGLTVADVVSIKVPDALKPKEPTLAPGPALAPPPTTPAGAELKAGEWIIVCPYCGKKFKIIIVPLE